MAASTARLPLPVQVQHAMRGFREPGSMLPSASSSAMKLRGTMARSSMWKGTPCLMRSAVSSSMAQLRRVTSRSACSSRASSGKLSRHSTSHAASSKALPVPWPKKRPPGLGGRRWIQYRPEVSRGGANVERDFGEGGIVAGAFFLAAGGGGRSPAALFAGATAGWSASRRRPGLPRA